MTHAIVYTETGGPEVLTLIDVPDPQPGAGEVLVHIDAAGVNPIDAKLRSGLRKYGNVDGPRPVGSDGAGVVTAVGDGVEGFLPGDDVVVSMAQGVYATDIVVPATKLTPRPPQVSAAIGAALGVPVSTAYQSLRSLDVGAGDTLLLHAGSGAVGQAAIQFATLAGATVVATSSPARFDRLSELGAIPVAYGDGLVDRIREAAPDGITVALDAAGTDEAIEASLALVADHDRIATIVRGPDAAGFGIRAFSGGSPTPLTPQEQAWRAEAIPVVVALLAAGAFSVELGPSLPLTEAAEAHRLIEQGVDGKIVLLP